jgi:hypothetical protein
MDMSVFVKNLLREILSFMNKIDPECSHTITIVSGRIRLCINEVNDWTISPFLKYFRSLMGTEELKSNVTFSLFAINLELRPSTLGKKAELQFLIEAPKFPDLLRKDGKNGYNLNELNLD